LLADTVVGYWSTQKCRSSTFQRLALLHAVWFKIVMHLSHNVTKSKNPFKL